MAIPPTIAEKLRSYGSGSISQGIVKAWAEASQVKKLKRRIGELEKDCENYASHAVAMMEERDAARK